MNGNGPPSESLAVQPTLKLSETVELVSVPIPKCLLRTKYDNRSRRIPWDVRGSLSGLSNHVDREAVCHMTAPREI